MFPELTNILLDSIGLTLSVVLLIITRHTSRYVAYDHRIFHRMLVFTFLLNALDLCAVLMQPTDDLLIRICLAVIATAQHALQMTIAFLWVRYVDYKVYQTTKCFRGKREWILAVPLLLAMAVLLVNLFTGFFFTIAPDGHYQPTQYVLFLHALSFIYVIYSIILPLTSSWKEYLNFPTPLFLVPVLAGNIAHLYLGNISVSWVATAVGFVALQLALQNDIGYMDPLTGLYNRHFLKQYLQNMIHRVEDPNNTSQLAGILVDMDGFKALNDTYGHMTGDTALQDVGEILRASLPMDAVACRFGGDEFIVIAILEKKEDVQKIVDSIRDHTKQHNESGKRNFRLHMSIGWTLYARNADTLDSFFGRMDHKMYREKEEHHSQMAEEKE